MRSLAIFILFSSFCCLTSGQEIVSHRAIQDLESRFANAEDVRWQKDRLGFQARFQYNNEDQKVRYSPSGYWLETITKITSNGLSLNVKQHLEDHYAGYEIRQVSMIETMGFFGFEVQVELLSEIKTLLLSDNGLVAIEE